MATKKLDRPHWELYFDRVSRLLEGEQVEVGVAGLALGDQIEADWIALVGLTYDAKGNAFNVLTDRIDHRISRPADIYVEYESNGLHSVEVIDAEGSRHIIRLRPPLALPAP